MTNQTINLQIPAGDKDAAEAAASFFNHLVMLKGGATELPESEQPAPQEQADPTPQAEPPQKQEVEAQNSGDEWPQERNGILVDSDGRTHDPEIDSSNKKCVKADGRWQAKRGVDKDYREQRVKELIAIANGAPPQEQQQYDSGSAFGGNQQPANESPTQHPNTPPAADMNPAQYFQTLQQVGLTPTQEQQLTSEFGWGSLSQAITAQAGDPTTFSRVIQRAQDIKGA